MSATTSQQSTKPSRDIRRPQPDPKWTATENYTLAHLHPTTASNASALDAALAHSHDQGLPPIACSRAFGKFLALQAKLINAKHALEVGTLGGYSSIWLASLNSDLHITTLEINPHNAAVAKQNIERAGVSQQIDVRVGSALQNLPKLLEEIEAGKLPKLDLVFIDADKLNNWNYFDFAVKGARKGAVILVDNVVQGGCISLEDDAWKNQEHVQGARTVIEKVGKDERVSATVLQTVGETSYDGFLFAVVL